ncbi:MAG: hypothetical protein E6929_10665 [Clostridium sp.]|nr:hypothetical protein [Clostridium sp.]
MNKCKLVKIIITFITVIIIIVWLNLKEGINDILVSMKEAENINSASLQKEETTDIDTSYIIDDTLCSDNVNLENVIINEDNVEIQGNCYGNLNDVFDTLGKLKKERRSYYKSINYNEGRSQFVLVIEK